MTHRRRFGIILVILTTLSMLLLVGGITYRAYQSSRHQRTLCTVLVKIIRDGDKSIGKLSYFQHHPAELRDQHQRTKDTIRRLDCGSL